MRNRIFLTALSAVLPLFSFAQTMPMFAQEGVDVYGTMYSNGHWGVDTYVPDSAGIYRFPAGSSGHIALNAPLIVAGGSTWHDGKIYCNVMDDDGTIGSEIPVWQVYDAETGQMLDSITLQDNWRNVSNSLAYDITTDKIYALARTNFNDFYLARIDPETAEWENVGTLEGHWYSSLACNRYGELYAVSTMVSGGQYNLVRINKETAKEVSVGEVSVSGLLQGDSFIIMGAKSALFFNNADDKLYWMVPSSSAYLDDYYTVIVELNLNTGAGTMAGYMPKEYFMTGAYLAEPELDAPSGVDDFAFAPATDGLLEGSLSFTAPSLTYMGDSIEGNLVIEISNQDSVLVRIEDVMPSQKVETGSLAMPYGANTLYYRAYDAQGRKGVRRTKSVYVGYDLPLNPTNIRLSAAGLELTLEWDTPQGGLHGNAIDTANLTYRIVRYPYEVVVEQDFKGNVYKETVPEDMTRYIYMVVSRYQGEDGYAAVSNALIVGDPLPLPYSTTFDTIADFYNYYQIIDNNQDGYTWVYPNIEGYMNPVYMYSETSAADDWIFTPPIVYDAGETYRLTFEAQSSYSEQLEKLEVTFGDSCSVDRQEQVLDIPAVSFDGETYSVEMVAEEKGIGFFGFHVYSDAFGGNCHIRSVSIEHVETGDTTSNEAFASVPSLRLWVEDGCLRMEGNAEGHEVEVFSVTGVRVYAGRKDSFCLPLETGVYIVRQDGYRKKVLVL